MIYFLGFSSPSQGRVRLQSADPQEFETATSSLDIAVTIVGGVSLIIDSSL